MCSCSGATWRQSVPNRALPSSTVIFRQTECSDPTLEARPPRLAVPPSPTGQKSRRTRPNWVGYIFWQHDSHHSFVLTLTKAHFYSTHSSASRPKTIASEWTVTRRRLFHVGRNSCAARAYANVSTSLGIVFGARRLCPFQKNSSQSSSEQALEHSCTLQAPPYRI